MNATVSLAALRQDFEDCMKQGRTEEAHRSLAKHDEALLKMRAARGGSVWRHVATGAEAVVVWGKRGLVAATYVNSPNDGWFGHEEDFRRDFEWLKGRKS